MTWHAAADLIIEPSQILQITVEGEAHADEKAQSRRRRNAQTIFMKRAAQSSANRGIFGMPYKQAP
jgi:hypothetical protein